MKHIYAFLIIALSTGARKGAVFDLKWDQVYIPEPETKRVEIEPTPQEKDGVISMPKKAYKHVVIKNLPLDLETREVVRGAYIDFGEGHGNKRRPQIPIGQNDGLMLYLLFCGDRSQPYVVSFRGKQIKDGVKKGLEAVWSCHGLVPVSQLI